jgi:putative endonuclease
MYNNTSIPLKNGIQIMSYYYVYILANRRNGTLYTGFTGNLPQRVHDHKNGFVSGFTKKYGVHTLVYCEYCEDRGSAILREKQIKEWKRRWKLELIEKDNPEWKDLYDEIIG